MVTSEAPTSRPTVLLVDDERPLVEMLRSGLNKEFEVQVALNTEDAEVSMKQRDYDVIVCDHLMPGEQGLDFLIRASELHPKTRRILVTGYINPELLSRSIGVAKLSRCMLKPVGLAELAQAIREVLAGQTSTKL